MSNNKKYDINFFQNYSEEKGGKCLSTDYTNVRTKLTFQCSDGHVWPAQPRKILEGSWCPDCATERNRKYTCDDMILQRNTEEAYYLAGFWAADGWVARSSGAYTIAVKLSSKDHDHVEKIKKAFKTNAPIRVETRTTTPPSGKEHTGDYSSLTFNSKQLFNDFAKFNIVPNKTYNLSIPFWLKNHPMIHHYLRGYIDGDGSFAIARNKNQKPHITFCMRGTHVFLQEFNEILYRNGVLERERKTPTPKDGKKEKAFDRVQFSGNTVISRMYDFLYKDATLFLDRKEKIAGKAKGWSIHSGGKAERKKPKGSIDISAEGLLDLAKKHKSYKKVAEALGCTTANLSILTKNLNIRGDFKDVIRGFSNQDVYNSYLELGKHIDVAKKYGIDRQTVKVIISKC